MRTLLLPFLLLAGCMRLALAAPPGPFAATYELSQGSIKFGTLERTLEIAADGSYVFSARMETSGIAALLHSETIREVSRGRFEQARFAPVSYDYSSSRGKRGHALRFDRASGQVERSDAGADWRAQVPADVLDKLVYQAQMMQDLTTQPASLRYTIADKNKIKTYEFANEGTEEVVTAAGTFRAVKLVRASTPGERQTTVWCAAGLDWLPVKVEYREKNGDLTTALLRDLRKP